MGKMRIAYTILAKKHECKGQLGREDMGLKRILKRS
jgi:hypothetical protein